VQFASPLLACTCSGCFQARSILSHILHVGRSRDSSVGIATGYGLDDQGEWEFESR
jgi:hypothetical protein